MTSFFPDVNVWLALSVAEHSHSAFALDWLNRLPADTTLLFSRYTQLDQALLRLASKHEYAAIIPAQT
jgi:predicted nucleic acid-binding protein